MERTMEGRHKLSIVITLITILSAPFHLNIDMFILCYKCIYGITQIVLNQMTAFIQCHLLAKVNFSAFH